MARTMNQKEKTIRLSKANFIPGQEKKSVNKVMKQAIKAYYQRPVQLIDTKGSPFLGKKNNPIHIIMFSDVQCGHCRSAHYAAKNIMKKYPRYLKISFLDMPFGRSNKRSQLTSFQLTQYALLARKHGKYFLFLDELFSLFKNKVYINKNEIEKIFQKIHSSDNWNQINKQLNSTNSIIQKQNLLAEKLKIEYAPAIFINGKLIGGWNNKLIEKIIQREIKKIKNKNHSGRSRPPRS